MANCVTQNVQVWHLRIVWMRQQKLTGVARQKNVTSVFFTGTYLSNYLQQRVGSTPQASSRCYTLHAAAHLSSTTSVALQPKTMASLTPVRRLTLDFTPAFCSPKAKWQPPWQPWVTAYDCFILPCFCSREEKSTSPPKICTPIFEGWLLGGKSVQYEWIWNILEYQGNSERLEVCYWCIKIQIEQAGWPE